MSTLKHGLLAVRRSYDFAIALIGAYPAVTFWLVVAYLAIRR